MAERRAKPVFIDNNVAFSGMPAPWQLDDIARSFTAIVSLATPAEHSWEGYDPRILRSYGLSFFWLSTAMYNAPTLIQLLSGLVWIARHVEAGGRILVHSYRGCGRAVLAAAAWLIYWHRASLTEAISRASMLLSCSLESMPQKSILASINMLRRIPGSDTLIPQLAGLGHSVTEEDEAALDYALVASHQLVAYNNSIIAEAEKAARALAGDDEGVLFRATRRVARVLDYRIAGMKAILRDKVLRVKIIIWIPRRMHPAYARRLKYHGGDELDYLAKVMASLVNAGSWTTEVENYDPDNIPSPD